MEKFWCPVCNQGWVLPAALKHDGTRIWLCGECEVMWLGAEKPSKEIDDTFSTYMEARGLPPLWTEIDLLAQ